jgi:hypothetical protein
MLDILQLRVHPDELDQLRMCQAVPPNDCVAAFTVKGRGQVWPVTCWDEESPVEKINVRGWFPLLDKIADEFLLWWPQGGCFFISRDKVTRRLAENDARGVMFLQLDTHRLTVVPQRQPDAVRVGPHHNGTADVLTA